VAISFEAANVQHEHEWRAWQQLQLPAGKMLMPGVVSHATNSSPTGFYAMPRLSAARMSLLARIAASGGGFTLTWSGPSCARLWKAPALRRRLSGPS
jgi:hypothetical protein